MTKFNDTELSSVGFRMCLSSVGLASCLYRLAALSFLRSDLFTYIFIYKKLLLLFLFYFFKFVVFGVSSGWHPIIYLCHKVQVAQKSLNG